MRKRQFPPQSPLPFMEEEKAMREAEMLVTH